VLINGKARIDPVCACRPVPILLVDDDSDLRDNLAEILSTDVGLSVVRAYDAASALYVLREHQPRPRAVLLDVQLGASEALGSRTLLEAMRADVQLRDIPVITMSGAPLPPEFPSRVHLEKPFGRDKLVQALKTAGVLLD
jgi:CheY-like chemotaxis protein